MRRIGIIGGGQLALLMGEEIRKRSLPFEMRVLDPTPGCPASREAMAQIVGDFSDPEKIEELSAKSDILTFEIELAGAATLESLARRGRAIHPSPATLSMVKDKFVQYLFMEENRIPVPKSYPLAGPGDLEAASALLGLPLILKQRVGSYDGRGNIVAVDQAGIREAMKRDDLDRFLAQEFVDFEKELSVIAARDTKGRIRVYPVSENIHQDNILHYTIAPARVGRDVREKAQGLAHSVMECLKGAGVFGIEMFLDKEERVYINEIAPRVHNSGHHTIEASATSQFEQHLRAISGLGLGETGFTSEGSYLMMNILGGPGDIGPYRLRGQEIFEGLPGVYLHMYGKGEVRSQRKMGHLTLTPETGLESPESMLSYGRELRSLLRFDAGRGDR